MDLCVGKVICLIFSVAKLFCVTLSGKIATQYGYSGTSPPLQVDNGTEGLV